ncbi:hypothetical protein B5F17_13405 [Butyricicoccus pullicaecorum]|uniref:Uncharacterized protein n=1 Tax=Butyricicoccus pullicaecorum TaxID=501571 RepID=A0A1Y4L2V4_9FIRM|nr:hypothetical protein [Butyricicoccus pullicaecorum]OUP51123.1 hypothetical protein B5F17_13405 [Butyricicoccus pullicaecorum]
MSFVISHRNVIVPIGGTAYPISRGFVGEVPDQVAQTAYFQALVKDGKISIPASKKDCAIAVAMEQEPERVEPAVSVDTQPEQSEQPDEEQSEDREATETEPEPKKNTGRKKKTEE